MHLRREKFESLIGVEFINFDLFIFFQKMRMIGKTHINKTMISGQRGLGVRLHEFFVIINVVNLKNDIIAHL